MLKRDEITPSTSPWNSPPNLIAQPKNIQAFNAKHGTNAAVALTRPENAEEVRVLYRLTNDMRCLNDRTWLDPFPLQSIPRLLDELHGSDRFSGNDIPDAFFSVVMESMSCPYTAFQTPDGHFQYTIMPQGSKNAASHFARVIHSILSPIKTVATDVNHRILWYQDDVCNHSKGLVSHLNAQQRVYNALRDNNLIFKVAKSTINFPSQKILGHVITASGRLPDPGLVKAITLENALTEKLPNFTKFW
jgi:hypothetical protein